MHKNNLQEVINFNCLILGSIIKFKHPYLKILFIKCRILRLIIEGENYLHNKKKLKIDYFSLSFPFLIFSKYLKLFYPILTGILNSKNYS